MCKLFENFIAFFCLLFLFAIPRISRVYAVYNFITEFDTQDPAVLISNDLPRFKNGTIENKLLPYVGNGHLASTVFDTTIFVNGLYNGHEGESHRARIPNIHDFFLNSLDTTWKDKQYVLHLKNGMNLKRSFFVL